MGKVIHPAYSGYLPYCIADQDAAAILEYEYPPSPAFLGGIVFKVDWEDAMMVWWRVREWEFRVFGNRIKLQDPDVSLDFGSMSGSTWASFWIDPLKKEEEKVCLGTVINESYFATASIPGYETWVGTTSPPTTGNPPVPVYPRTLNYDLSRLGFAYGSGGIKLVYDRDDNKYFMEFVVEWSGQLNQLETLRIIFPSPTHGQPDKIYTIIGSASEPPVGVTMEIRPRLYWPYEGTYNTSTGKFILPEP